MLVQGTRRHSKHAASEPTSDRPILINFACACVQVNLLFDRVEGQGEGMSQLIDTLYPLPPSSSMASMHHAVNVDSQRRVKALKSRAKVALGLCSFIVLLPNDVYTEYILLVPRLLRNTSLVLWTANLCGFCCTSFQASRGVLVCS
jgi:hypothetical protein